jgi:hypothetical protein
MSDLSQAKIASLQSKVSREEWAMRHPAILIQRR